MQIWANGVSGASGSQVGGKPAPSCGRRCVFAVAVLWIVPFGLYCLLVNAFETYSAFDAPLTRIDVRVRIVLFLVYAVMLFMVDTWVGLAVAVFILYSAVQLAKETISPLLGESASPELCKVIADVMHAEPRVLGFHDLMVHDYGPGQRFGSLHVEMDQREDPLSCHELIDDLERLCLEKHNIHLVIHYDPVVVGDPEQDSLRATIYDALQSVDSRLNLHDFRMVRGAHHTNLIFDVTLPADLSGKEGFIGKTIDKALADRDEKMKYYTVITFDAEAFNRPVSG